MCLSLLPRHSAAPQACKVPAPFLSQRPLTTTPAPKGNTNANKSAEVQCQWRQLLLHSFSFIFFILFSFYVSFALEEVKRISSSATTSVYVAQEKTGSGSVYGVGVCSPPRRRLPA
ncbi:unnamed protein product [Amoebophrya sp. A120]|nr:unnamed protein product [Amoebophrya sp. A120]|eukprot:GSA120T00005165001.1